ncbi:MAG: hypothetical protein K6F50_05075 [Kiritimatiellae bacterium]|nr:hypothetical protein [Kiritimatiellia bacterium]
MSSWGWRERRRGGARGSLPRGLRALSASVPWLTAGLLLLMLSYAERAFTLSEGVLFELPASQSDVSAADIDETADVALLMPHSQGTLVFFNDQRYILEDDAQMQSFSDAMRERLRTVDRPTLYVLADLRIRHGTIQRFAGIARRSGASRILFAEKKGRADFE